MKNIIGHKRQQEQLLNNIEMGNLTHAYLFSGPPHLGKFTLAKEMATQLLTQGMSPVDAEEKRRRCLALTDPDFLVVDELWTEKCATPPTTSNISQEERMKHKIKTDAISIHDIRSMYNHCSSTKTSHWKCCIIHSIERMQVGAANAFLKLLEEPPSGTIFFLTTQSENSLLPTILSRVRVLRFHPVENSILLPLLKGVPDDEAILILHLAQGAPGKVKLLIDNAEELRRMKQLHTQATEFWRQNNTMKRLQWLQEIFDDEDTSDDEIFLHLSLTLREQREILPAHAMTALLLLGSHMKTNAHRGLLLEQFILALSRSSC